MEIIKELLKEIIREVVNEEIVPRLDEIQRLLTKSPVGWTYTTKQAEELLGCNKSTLWRWAKEGKLVPVKRGGRGGRNLYRYEDIERFTHKITTNFNTTTMTLKDFEGLIGEGKTIEEILALRGESAKELLRGRSIYPPEVLNDKPYKKLTQSQLRSLLEAMDKFSEGNYDYVPKEGVPFYDLDDIKETIQAYNNSYLYLHILENLSEE